MPPAQKGFQAPALSHATIDAAPHAAGKHRRQHLDAVTRHDEERDGRHGVCGGEGEQQPSAAIAPGRGGADHRPRQETPESEQR